MGVHFSLGPNGGLFGDPLRSHLWSPFGVLSGGPFLFFWGPSWNPIGGNSWAGVHLGAFLGGPFLRMYKGHSWGWFGWFGGVHWGPFWRPFRVYFWGHFEVVLYGFSHIDNSLAFPTSIWKCRDGLGIPVYKLFNSGKMLSAKNCCSGFFT